MSGSISDSNFGRLLIVPETTFGTVPASPAMQTMRITSSDFGATKETAISDEVRSDRMVSTMAEVSASSQGTLGYELSLGGSFDTLMEAALCGTFTTSLNVAAAVITGNKFSLTAAFANAQVGQWVLATGYTNPANNGWFRVTAVTANDITVAGTLVVESAAAGKFVKGRMLRNGVVKRSFTVEEGYLDIGQFFLFRGMRVGTMSLDVAAGQLVTGQFGLQGTQGSFAAASAAGSVLPATSSQIVNATSNVGSVLESGTLTSLATAIQGFNMNLDNALRNQMAVGSKFPTGIGYGRQTVTGTMNAYFQDTSLYTKFLNHAASALSFAFADAAGNAMRITLPRVFYTSDNPSISGIDQDVMESIDWTAVMDPTTGCQIQIDMIPA